MSQAKKENDKTAVSISPGFNKNKNIGYTVTVIEAKNLPGVDSSGTSDPYVVVDFGEKTCETDHILKTCNPTWNKAFTFKSRQPLSKIGFTLKDWNAYMPNVTLGEASFDPSVMGNDVKWEGSLNLSGKFMKSSSTLKIKVETANYTTVTKAISSLLSSDRQEWVKKVMMEKASNLAKMTYVTACNEMKARNLEGNIEIETKIGIFVFALEAEISRSEEEKAGKIEIVEETKENVAPTQTKPTKGMQAQVEVGIKDVLNNLETTMSKIGTEVSATLKAGVEIGFVVIPIPKLEMQVRVMLGVNFKSRYGFETKIAIPKSPQDIPTPVDDQEINDALYKVATGMSL